MKKTLGSLALGILLGACNSVDSDAIRTSGIWADFEVEADGDGQSEVTAVLRVGSITSLDFVRLTGGDELSCTASTTGYSSTKEMIESSAFGVTAYSSTFDNEVEGLNFKINFDRSATGTDSAPDSSTTLPAPFTLAQPTLANSTASITSFSRGSDTIWLDWDPFGESDAMSYDIDGSCIQSQASGLSSDTGRLEIPSGSILALSGQETQSCTVTIKIFRTRLGSVDSGFGGGAFRAVQAREVTLTANQ